MTVLVALFVYAMFAVPDLVIEPTCAGFVFPTLVYAVVFVAVLAPPDTFRGLGPKRTK